MVSDLLSCGVGSPGTSPNSSRLRPARGAATKLSMQHLLPCLMPTAHHDKAAT